MFSCITRLVGTNPDIENSSALIVGLFLDGRRNGGRSFAPLSSRAEEAPSGEHQASQGLTGRSLRLGRVQLVDQQC